jgi:hypothetical protein
METWFWTSEIRQWIEVFYELYGNEPNLTVSKEEMHSKEPDFVDYLMGDTVEFSEEEIQNDSLFLYVLGSEFCSRFSQHLDYSVALVDSIDEAIWTYSMYDLEIQMPGKIVNTNGYAIKGSENGSSKGILWTVKGECFLTEEFSMWAESRVNNYLLWILTATFVLFVGAGLVRFQRKK